MREQQRQAEAIAKGIELPAKRGPGRPKGSKNKKTIEREQREARLAKERRIQEARLKIKERFGKNAILRGLNFAEGATAKERNRQIGGHKA